MRVDICIEGVRLTGRGITRPFLSRLTERVAALCGAADSSVTLVATGDDYMRALNRDYRHKDRTTDVISFASREAPFPGIRGGTEDLGEIYLCLDQAQRQAVEYGVSIRDEVTRLVVHGFLHLLGYDHERSRTDARSMEERESAIRASLTGS